MTIKQYIWRSVAGGWLGRLLHWLDPVLSSRPRLFGLRNPVYMPQMTMIMGDTIVFADQDSHLIEMKGADYRVKVNPDTFEEETIFIMQNLVKSDYTVFDIGANNGFFTALMAKQAHRGHVFAFEPVAKFAEQASLNCALNAADNVTILNCGLGTEAGEMTMKVNVSGKGLQGTSTLIADNFHVAEHPEHYEERTVRIHRLDDLVKTLDLPSRIGFMKIDTEGFDTYVLEGGLETIRANMPVIFVEAHTKRIEQAGKSWAWYLETFADHHILIVHAPTRAKPYVHFEPLTADQPEIAVNLLMLPRKTVLAP